MKKTISIIISFLLLQMPCLASSADQYVIVSHRNCPVDTLTAHEVQRIFLGKMKKWPDGSTINPVINANTVVHTPFTRHLLNKSPAQFSNYWKKILFSGKSMLPVFVNNDLEAKIYVATRTNALTYIDINSLDDTLKKITITK